jgi:hypothetical protein
MPQPAVADSGGEDSEGGGDEGGGGGGEDSNYAMRRSYGTRVSYY